MTNKEEPGAVRAPRILTEDFLARAAKAGFEPRYGCQAGDLPEWEAWGPVVVARFGPDLLLGRVHRDRPGEVQLLGLAGARLWVPASEVSPDSVRALERRYARHRAAHSPEPAMMYDEAQAWIYELTGVFAALQDARQVAFPGGPAPGLQEARQAWEAARERAVQQLLLMSTGRPWRDAP